MSNIVKLRRKPRPLQKTYHPNAPYEVEREDEDDGSITYHVVDMRPDSYRTLCSMNDDRGKDPLAKHYTEQMVRGMNLLVQYGMEVPPPARRKTPAHD